ncbi:glycosyltransferase family 4 protein [Corynebacterium sp. HMSC08C04]|uniref:glycosyltransferase family 4 protein n=1 Tax=Corynebacterium sp. HMSC08C04 TaxID=1581137 RepID=UPI0008A5BF4F
MRILVLSQYWSPENGVPQRRWSWLAAQLRERGVEVTAIAPPPRELRKLTKRQWVRKQIQLLRPQAVELGPSLERVYRTGFIPASSSLTGRAFNQLVIAISTVGTVFSQKIYGKNRRPDFIIGTVPALPTAVSTWVVAKLLGKPYVIDLRDAWPELLDESKSWNFEVGETSFREKVLGGMPLRLLASGVTRFLNMVYSQALALIVTSEQHAKFLAEAKAIDCPIFVIRNVFPPSFSQTVEPYSRSDGRLNVLYAGTVGRAQGLSDALKAIKILKEEYGVQACLRVIGDGAAWGALKRQSEEFDLPVEFLHSIPSGSLVDHYKWADTSLVHLANWPVLELAIPSKTYELMEKGMHLSVVAKGETAQIVQEHSAGIVVPPGEPHQLATAWAEAVQQGDAFTGSATASEWVEREREIVVNQTLEQFLGLLRNASRGRNSDSEK